MKKGRCLASQEIRELIKAGVIQVPNFDEGRIQPSSFEPVIGDTLFRLDTDEQGLFRTKQDQSVYRALLELPERKRRKVDISDGYELRRGFSYLFPLEERVSFGESFRYMKSSPKSSTGRVFPVTRLLTDHNPCFDEAGIPHQGMTLQMWLLLQPLAFNLIAGPGLSFNQLRFFAGFDAQLRDSEIVSLWGKSPLLLSKTDEGMASVPVSPAVAEALQLHLDLKGAETEGIVALRARQNPEPIDLRKSQDHTAEDYFEPVKSKDGSLVMRRGEHYLLTSEEVLNIPKHLNAELAAHSHHGLMGPLHRAGFADNGFHGKLVFEVTSEELSDVRLQDGMPIGELRIYRTGVPDKIYGKKIGSNYQLQGLKVAKYFRDFDFKSAARNYEKLNREVLVQDAMVLTGNRKANPFGFISSEDAKKILMDVSKGFFHWRYDCEDDPSVLQVIPYTILFGPKKSVFSYVRAKDIADYGDKRLFGKHSIGLGGHIIRGDYPDYARRCLEREVFEEEVDVQGHITEPVLLGTLFATDSPVDRVHFGLVYGIYVDGDISPKERSISTGRLIPISEIQRDPDVQNEYETWSSILIPHLDKIWRLTSP